MISGPKKPGPRSLTQAGFLSASGLIRWRKPFAETTTGFDSTRDENRCSWARPVSVPIATPIAIITVGHVAVDVMPIITRAPIISAAARAPVRAAPTGDAFKG